MRSEVFKITRWNIIFGLLTIVCMIVIFCFSMEDSSESSDKSSSVTKVAVEVFVKDYDQLPVQKQESLMDKAEHIIRKLAHYSIYTVLGFLASCAVGKRRLFSKGSLCTLIFCFLYACTDELHQYFVPGRACRFTDVLIDTGGALTGILISLGIICVVHKVQKIRS